MTSAHSASRRTMIAVAKFTLAAAILAYLVAQANEGFSRLLEQRVAWPPVLAGIAYAFAACAISFVRWHLLIRALEIDVRLVDSMRLGALGVALNFVSPGLIGGDFLKAIFLAHGQPGRRTEAVATVVADRVLGLLTMLLIATIGILLNDWINTPSPALRVLCQSILIATVVGLVVGGLLFAVPALTGPSVERWLKALPILNDTMVRLLRTVRVYRSQSRTLLAAFALSGFVAVLSVGSFYLIARGMPIQEPTWSEHLVIVPVASLVGAIPVTPSGLGTFELAIEELYRAVPGGAGIQRGDGTLVALARRSAELAVALVGLVFYLTHRREVEEVYAEAEEVA